MVGARVFRMLTDLLQFISEDNLRARCGGADDSRQELQLEADALAHSVRALDRRSPVSTHLSRVSRARSDEK